MYESSPTSLTYHVWPLVPSTLHPEALGPFEASQGAKASETQRFSRTWHARSRRAAKG